MSSDHSLRVTAVTMRRRLTRYRERLVGATSSPATLDGKQASIRAPEGINARGKGATRRDAGDIAHESIDRHRQLFTVAHATIPVGVRPQDWGRADPTNMDAQHV